MAEIVSAVDSRKPAGDPASGNEDPRLRPLSYTALAIFFLSLIAYNFVDIDLWHQVALIRESLSAGHLLKVDPFAYTPTRPAWIDHEWGAGAIAFFLTAWFGGRAILAVKFAFALGTGFFCLRSAERTGADFRIVGVCAPLAIFLAHLGFFSAVRAQVYTFFFTALLMLLWQRGLQAFRWMVAWLLVFPLWVNLHGGFVVGIGLTALYCLEQFLRGKDVRRLLFVLAGMLAETLLTPYGISYWTYLKRALSMSRPYAPEWRPVWDLGTFWMLCFAMSVAVILYALKSAGPANMPGILPLAATALEAGLHRKLLPLFAIVWMSYVPFYLQQTPAGQWMLSFMRRRSRFVQIVWASFGCVCLLATIRQKPWELSVPQPIYPVGAVQYLAEHKFQGNVMVPFRLGAYVSWKLFPAVKVSLDSRYEEIYPDEVMDNIFGFYQASPGWRGLLARYPTDVVIVPNESAVAEKMSKTEWRMVYRDRDFEIYSVPGRWLPSEDKTSMPFAGTFP
jgi:hypothetical protein